MTLNALQKNRIEQIRQAAIEVLLYNRHGPGRWLPRVARWGYPEPYTRDIMICSLGILAERNEDLIESLRRSLAAAASQQSRLGQIPSLLDDSRQYGSSDTTPWFLIALALYRRETNQRRFLADAASKAMRWMEYQSQTGGVIVGQLPTTDWRDEQWVLGSGLYVNMLVYTYLRLHGQHEKARQLKREIHRYAMQSHGTAPNNPAGLVLPGRPYYALWSHKVYWGDRFDLLGNCLAILSGLASPSRAAAIVQWVKKQCSKLKREGDLAVDLPPNLFPYVRPSDEDWVARYEKFNRPGEYHNGGVWPFVCSFYVAALVAVGELESAEEKLAALTDLVVAAHNRGLSFGFNEWFKAQDGKPRGQDWQSWSAAMYLYAAACVERRATLFFQTVREEQ